MEIVSKIESFIWKKIASDLKVETVASLQKVEGLRRQNRITLLYGNGGVNIHCENGIFYKLDISKCMFSSGNGTERDRIVNIILASTSTCPEIVVDLFCGIGYFSLPVLARIPELKLSHLYAVDWNDDALEFFSDAIKLNSADPSKVTFLHCDSRYFYIESEDKFNFHPSTKKISMNNENVPGLPDFLLGVADRIFLGLIPSSEMSWGAAVRIMNKEKGATFHVHGVSARVFHFDAFPYLIVCKSHLEDTSKNIREVRKRTCLECGQSFFTCILQEDTVLMVDKTDSTKYVSCDILGSDGKLERRHVSSIPKYIEKYGRRLYLGRNIGYQLSFAQHVLHSFSSLIFEELKSGYETSKMKVQIEHVECVKSYCPSQYHFVVDISCSPITEMENANLNAYHFNDK